MLTGIFASSGATSSSVSPPPASVQFLPDGAGAPKVLFDTQWPGMAFDVTADGQRLIVITPVEAQVRSPITVVLNWQAGLKK